MTHRLSLFFLLLTLMSVRAATITLTGSSNSLFNTGYDGSTFDKRPAPFTTGYSPLADSHYTIVAIFPSLVDVPSTVFLPAPLTTYQAYSQVTANELAHWNTSGSSRAVPGQWISVGVTTANDGINQSPIQRTSVANPNNFQGATNFVYDYRLRITNIPIGYKLTISGTTTSDNSLVISANGASKGFFDNESARDNNPLSYQVLAPFSISFLSKGSNFLDFNVLNDASGGPTGLQVFDLAGTAVPLSQILDPTALAGLLSSGLYTPAQITTMLTDGTLPALTSGYFTTTQITNLINTGIIPSSAIGLPDASRNGTAVAEDLNRINASGATNVAFVGLTLDLIGLADGTNADTYDAALRSLSPESLSVLAEDNFNNDSFMTLDLDDYLAHRRTGTGDLQVCAGGIDTSGLQVDSTTNAGMNSIKSHLDSRPLGVPEQSPNQRMARDCNCEDRINLFVRGEVLLSQNFSGDGLDHTEGTTTSGEVGADYQIGKHWLVGALFSYDHTETDLDQQGSNATSDGYAPGVYASYADGGWYNNALATYRRNFYDTERDISFDSFNSTATASPQGSEEMAYDDGGYEFHHNGFTYGPMVGLMYNHLNIDSYDESGSIAALNVGNQSADSLRSRVGGRFSYVCPVGSTLLTPHFSASWQHEYLDGSRGITSSFNSAPSNSFTIYTRDPSRDAALLDLGLDADFQPDVTAFFNYDVQAGQRDYFGQMIQAGVKLAF